MSKTIDLSLLALPFPQQDVEFRVSRAGVSNNRTWCKVFPYVTVRGVQSRLDEAVGPENWALTKPIQMTHEKRCAICVGISIRIGDEWVTKWDLSELTDSSDNIPPFKGGFSGAVKRAACNWGIFRYGYHIGEMYAEVSEKDPGVKGWNWAKLPAKAGGGIYFWSTPKLPSWALPKEGENDTEIAQADLNNLKRAWVEKFAPDSTDRSEMAEGFTRFVKSIVGDFPVSDHATWTRDGLELCQTRIDETTEPGGVTSDVPFDS